MRNKRIQDLRYTEIIKKIRGMMKRDGVYVTLFICFCIVSIVAVWTAKENFRQFQDKGYIDYQEENQNSEAENEIKAVDAANNLGSQNILFEEENEESLEEVNASSEVNNPNTVIITDKPIFGKPVLGKV